MPIPRLTTPFTGSSKAQRRAITLRASSAMRGSAPSGARMRLGERGRVVRGVGLDVVLRLGQHHRVDQRRRQDRPRADRASRPRRCARPAPAPRRPSCAPPSPGRGCRGSAPRAPSRRCRARRRWCRAAAPRRSERSGRTAPPRRSTSITRTTSRVEIALIRPPSSRGSTKVPEAHPGQRARLAGGDVAIEVADDALRQVPALDLAGERQRRDLGDQAPVPADHPSQQAVVAEAVEAAGLAVALTRGEHERRGRAARPVSRNRASSAASSRSGTPIPTKPDVVMVSPGRISATASAAESSLRGMADVPQFAAGQGYTGTRAVRQAEQAVCRRMPCNSGTVVRDVPNMSRCIRVDYGGRRLASSGEPWARTTGRGLCSCPYGRSRPMTSTYRNAALRRIFGARHRNTATASSTCRPAGSDLPRAYEQADRGCATSSRAGSPRLRRTCGTSCRSRSGSPDATAW